MSKLILEQFKTDNKNTNESRLTLDQFKSQSSNNVNNEELEKLTGGVLGACHSLLDQAIKWVGDVVDTYNNSPGTGPIRNY
ncbi:hypothetical protein [Chryseobacterium sp. ISL-6]|uniref:hypothetical protein n=1 Tax=Chryseobacterium sp. ISL-6 TaxID=2819143 RepID=UPI001BEC3B4F|nr:hypothetical protein [Chryseobacterium sp. ISL-6]MBT2623623.1 hypothetical protein [Chryseobacterium sp. ISL-6]